MATTFMNLNLPVPTVTLGPAWATQLNAALERVDEHDHSSGRGVKIKPAGIDINAELPFNNNRATELLGLQLQSQSAALSGLPNANLIHSVGGDLYFTSGGGTAIQLTSGGSIAPSPTNTNTLEYQAFAADVTIANTDTFVVLGMDTTVARTITLPLANTVSVGRFYVVKDATGDSESNAITVDVSGSDTIDGAASVDLQSAYGATYIISNGDDSWFIF